jgi:hypothetical protein
MVILIYLEEMTVVSSEPSRIALSLLFCASERLMKIIQDTKKKSINFAKQ